jgi:hypothetical protein
MQFILEVLHLHGDGGLRQKKFLRGVSEAQLLRGDAKDLQAERFHEDNANRLPAGKLNAVRTLLEVMVELLARSAALAPLEEEEIAVETVTALDCARALRSREVKASRTKRSYATSN